MKSSAVFLFFHYGKIPGYLSNAIEHVRIFNPNSQIYLITDSIKDTSRLDRFDVVKFKIEEFDSKELSEFKEAYQHISCFSEKFERFVLERWFVAETLRKSAPDQVYILQDSDVAVFGGVDEIVASLPKCPISMGGDNPHFTFITGSVSDFLNFIMEVYCNPEKLSEARVLHRKRLNSDQIYNLGEMEFIELYMKASDKMQNYKRDTSKGYVDSNIHRTEGFDFLQLRRRCRKIVVWQKQGGYNVPYFKNGEVLSRAFLLHFQGPGKRVFYRFNGGKFFNTKAGFFVLNKIFQDRNVANLL
jgi:hypothetical protein